MEGFAGNRKPKKKKKKKKKNFEQKSTHYVTRKP